MSRDIEIKAKINAKGVEDGLGKIADKTKDLGKEASRASVDADKLGAALNDLAQQAQSSAGGLAGAIAQGKIMADVAEQIGAKIGEAIKAMISLGTQTEQLIARFGAMKNNLTSAKEAYQAFNDVGRNTNYDMNAVYNMGMQLMNLGYNAQQAAEMIEIVADSAAGLGKGQDGAQALMDSLNRMRSTGMFTIRELKALQEQGVHVEKALADAFGTDIQTAIELVRDNAIDGKDAFEILTNYMKGEFAGAMAESKNNVVDLWSDVSGNVQTALGEIGSSIAEAFNQSGIIQDMIDITQDFVNLVRSDGVGVFSDLKEAASFVLEEIAGLLKIVWQGIKAVILVGSEMYSAFRTLGSQIADALSPIIQPLAAIYKAVSGIIKTLGGEISAGIDASWAEKYGGGYYDPTDSYGATGATNYKGNGNYKAKLKESATKASGGSGAKGNPMAEYNFQLQKLQSAFSFNEKLIKTQEDAYKKITDAANASALASLEGEAKKQKQLELTQEALIKAQNLDNAATARKIANFKAQIEIYQSALDAGIAPDGTAEKIALLEQQITQEEKLLKVRQDMTTLQLNANADINNNEASKETEKNLEKQKGLWDDYAGSVAASIGDAVGSVIDGQQTIGQALATMARNLIKNALTMLAQWLSLVAILAAFGDPTPGRHASVMLFGVGDKYQADPTTSGGLIPKGRAAGGLITGPGTSTSDTAGLFALSNGEYVLRAEAVSRLGVPFLDGINSGNYDGFAAGGAISSRSVSNDSSMKAAVGSSLVLNISAIDATGFGDFLSRGGLNAIKQALTDDDRIFASTAGVW